jgi:hypothetical protein
MCHE